MKLIRTTTPIQFGRSGKSAIIAMAINIEWLEDQNRWKISVKDHEQIPTGNTEPGTPVFSYRPMTQENGGMYKTIYKSPEEVNALVDYFAVDLNGVDFTNKFRKLLTLASIYENQVNPPYSINPADLEFVDQDDEIVQ